MLVQIFHKCSDIPGSDNFSEHIPVFATQCYADYLKELKGHEIVWFANLDDNNKVSFLIPFASIKKMIFKKGYFITGILSISTGNNTDKEKEFLENVIIYIKNNKLCDWIQQGPVWALFNTFPSGSKAVNFGTYRIFLTGYKEEVIFKTMNRYLRKDINYAVRNKVEVKSGEEYLNDCLALIENTSKGADLHSPSLAEIEKLKFYFKDNLKIYVSYFNNVAQSSAIFLRNSHCAYGLYAGSIAGALRGANALLFWEAIKDSMAYGCGIFDFVGGRINPPPGSKLERIQRFKEHFGSEFVQGYLWKMNLSALKCHVYNIIVKLVYFMKAKKYKPDIIDQELKRIN